MWTGGDGSERIYDDKEEFLERLCQLSPADARTLVSHVYGWDGKLREIRSNGRYTNHAQRPACGTFEELVAEGGYPIAADGSHLQEQDWSEWSFALKDIAVGDEITENYGTYDPLDWYEELCVTYGVESASFCARKYIALDESSICVPFEVRQSSVGGQGIFAKKPIPAGTCVWDFDKARVETFSEPDARKHLESLGFGAVKAVCEWAYWVHGTNGPTMVDLVEDVGRCFNHSCEPNFALGSVMSDMGTTQTDWQPQCSYAIRDIAAGEELFDNYNTYGDEPEWFCELARKAGIDSSYLEEEFVRQ